MSVIEILEGKLLGNFYSRISVGDTFDLFFDRFWLISQDVVSTDESTLNKLLTDYPPTTKAIDKEYIAKSTILTTTLRKKITEVSLNQDSSLALGFENGVKLLFPTDTEIVDWQWAINDKGNDPYTGCLVGCFNPGEVQIGNC